MDLFPLDVPRQLAFHNHARVRVEFPADVPPMHLVHAHSRHERDSPKQHEEGAQDSHTDGACVRGSGGRSLLLKANGTTEMLGGVRHAMSCARPEDCGTYVHQTLRLLHRYKTCCNTASLGGVTWWAMVVSIKVPHAQVQGSGEDRSSTRRAPPPGETRQAADRVRSRGTSRWCPTGRPRWPAGKEERKH